HIGQNPTYGQSHLKVEAHLIGFQGDIYGNSVSIEFQDRIRDVRRFANVEELREQLQRDIAQAAQLAKV
ncbi:MAG: bifunctional riboflavin kinase/FAD synthetase, partial [Candidatus Moraniibacteriota bacterium]